LEATHQYVQFKTGANDIRTDEGLWAHVKGDAGQYYVWRRTDNTPLFERLIGGIQDDDKLDTSDGKLPELTRRGTLKTTPKQETLTVVHDHGAQNTVAAEMDLQFKEQMLLAAARKT
jgi:hypothetical protein